MRKGEMYRVHSIYIYIQAFEILRLPIDQNQLSNRGNAMRSQKRTRTAQSNSPNTYQKTIMKRQIFIKKNIKTKQYFVK